MQVQYGSRHRQRYSITVTPINTTGEYSLVFVCWMNKKYICICLLRAL